MKSKSYIILMMLILAISIAGAQTDASAWGFGIEGGVAKGDNAEGDEEWVPSGRGFIQLKLSNNFLARLGLSYARLEAGDVYNTKTMMPDARLLFLPLEYKGFSPYIYAGLGLSKNMESSANEYLTMMPLGVGFQQKIKRNVLLELSGGYNLAFSDDFDGRIRTGSQLNRLTDDKHDGYFNVMLGLTFISAPVEKKVVTVIEAPKPIEPKIVKPLPVEEPKKVEKPVEKIVEKPVIDPKTLDADGDGLTDTDETTRYFTNPNKADSDGDGLSDSEEILKYKTDPNKADTDGDGLSDYEEIMTYRTDPLKADTDGGGMNDGAEIKAGKNPLDPKDDLMDLSKSTRMVLDNVFFATGKADIMTESVAALNKVYDSMVAFPDVNVVITGYTDNVGSADLNRALSLRRAQAVKDWLVSKNINPARIQVVGKGAADPIAPNDTVEGRAKNRRIEFEVKR